MFHMLPHLPQNTFTQSLSPTFYFRPSSLSMTCFILAHSGLEHETLREPKADTRNLHLPQVTGPNWHNLTISSLKKLSWTEILGKIYSLEELSSTGILGTDPYQIPERILGDDYQHPITEETEETGKFWRGHALRPIKDTLGLRFSWKHCRLGSWRWRITKNAGLTAVCIWVRGKLRFSLKTHSLRETRSKNNTEERGKCKSYSSWSLQGRERARNQIHLKGHERLGNRMHCFHQGATNQEISSKILVSNVLIPNWEDLFLKVIKITCSVRQDRNWWKQEQVGSLNSCINELQQQAYARGLELQNAHHGYVESRREQGSTTRRIINEGTNFAEIVK